MNRNVVFLPIESIESRYTAQMRVWVEDALRARTDRHSVTVIDPRKGLPMEIESGEFLDCFGTIDYKACQISEVASMFKANQIAEDTLFLVGDCWFPGIEAIKYMAELAGITIKMAGWHYAGMSDTNDMLHRNLSRWAGNFEMSLMFLFDVICVGSDYHAGLMVDYFPEVGNLGHKLKAYGLAWRPTDVVKYRLPKSRRKKIVAFPHRLADEKQPLKFFEAVKKLQPEFPDWQFIVSSNRDIRKELECYPRQSANLIVHKSKEEYYRWLATCSVFYSSAVQETFGYALHEAIALGLVPVCPNRCSYPQGLSGDSRYLYEDGGDLDMLRRAMRGETPPPPYEYTEKFSDSIDRFLTEALA